jgi:hypothetical protein
MMDGRVCLHRPSPLFVLSTSILTVIVPISLIVTVVVHISLKLTMILPCPSLWQYHKNCADQWLMNHTTCPMCKTDVKVGTQFVTIYAHHACKHART